MLLDCSQPGIHSPCQQLLAICQESHGEEFGSHIQSAVIWNESGSSRIFVRAENNAKTYFNFFMAHVQCTCSFHKAVQYQVCC